MASPVRWGIIGRAGIRRKRSRIWFVGPQSYQYKLNLRRVRRIYQCHPLLARPVMRQGAGRRRECAPSGREGCTYLDRPRLGDCSKCIVVVIAYATLNGTCGRMGGALAVKERAGRECRVKLQNDATRHRGEFNHCSPARCGMSLTTPKGHGGSPAGRYGMRCP